MQNKTSILIVLNLLFLGCTKQIQIHDRKVGTTPYPIVYEEVIDYEASREVVYTQPHQTRPVASEPIVSININDRNIRPLDALDKLREGVNIMLLDVRTADEIPRDGKITNSMLLPLGSLSRNLYRLDKSNQIIVYCTTGNRSLEAMKFLRRQGFDAINMLGGIEAWKKNHLHVVWK